VARAAHALFLLSWLLPLDAFSQNNTIRVVFDDPSPPSSTVGVFERKGVLYASLKDLGDAFQLGTYENKAARKIEIKRAQTRLKATGGNPYLVFTDPSGRTTTHQLPVDVLFAAGTVFAPLQYILPFVDRISGWTSSVDVFAGVVKATHPPLPTTYDIPAIAMEPKANGLVIRIRASRPLPDVESWLRQDGWLYVTVADARADTLAIMRMKPEGLVRQIVAIQSTGSVQLTFKLAGKIAATEIIRDERSHDILVSIRPHGNEDKALLERKRREIQAGLEAQRNRWRLDAIVLDPGHGGHDTGTIGVGKTREKDITLRIALKLGKLLQQRMKDVKVVYTRKDDRFVELDRRGQMANESDGRLFISIHCNSLKKKPSNTRGFEVYLLRPGRTEEAIEIAERENAVIELEEGYQERYQELTEENFILVTMAQSAYLKASEVFADILQQELEDHLAIPNRGIKQAGFYVLVGAAMPKILLETAYLSNREDERFLKSEAGQQQIAEAMYQAIKRYKEEYEKLLLEGRDLGLSD
jgi:N-acetylmuramoyl-L-alanine amidase